MPTAGNARARAKITPLGDARFLPPLIHWARMLRWGARRKEGTAMMFVALLKTRGNNTFQEGVARRMQWDYPEGVRVLGEYWLETESPRVVSVMEADGMEAFGQIRMHWNDMFEIEVFPAVTGERGMEMARQAMSGQATAKG